jgi:hypothetical protein
MGTDDNASVGCTSLRADSSFSLAWGNSSWRGGPTITTGERMKGAPAGSRIPVGGASEWRFAGVVAVLGGLFLIAFGSSQLAV